ncbi:hypothetical protein DZC78_08855 [Olleya aquimaris]|uniref:hypothetical protein n=1 Tax=Olleya sp. ITB9 TaxID=1715648 RepID=UPI0004809FEE|nr:hypothetical protein [Olleya sp. ITB9]AXO80486.1 hypothetical protein DZC78_08855 [Olleya aquimaris]
MKLISSLFEYTGIAILFINAILFFKSYTSKKSMAFKYFSIYLGTSLIIVVITSTLSFFSKDNLYLSHFYFIGQFILLSLFYKELFNSTQKKIVNTILILVLLTLSIQYANKPNLFFKFFVFEIFITSFPIVIYSIIHLYNSISKKGAFIYINAGILIYLTTSTLIFILGDYLSEYNNTTIKKIWLVNKVLYLLYLILIFVEWKTTLSMDKNK